MIDPAVSPSESRPPWPAPLSERWLGPAVFRLLPASHPSADLEPLVALIGTLGFAGLLVLPLAPIATLLDQCQFHRFTGIPCMSCGTTRAVLALARGEVLEALRMNPLLAACGLLFAAYTPVAWVLWLRRLPRPRLGLPTAAGRWAAAAVVLLLILANWAFLILDGR